MHDGSFCGFLCATAEVLNSFKSSQVIHEVCGPNDVNLFDDTVTVRSDAGRGEALYRRLAAKTGEDAMLRLLEAFCSGFENISRSLAIMAVRLWHEGRLALENLSNPHALAVEKAAHRTRTEAHLYTGIARFSELSDGSWYAAIDAQTNILPLIGDHFAARYANMRFVIHDTGRETALLHEQGASWYIASDFRFTSRSDTGLPSGVISNDEARVRSIWKRYFDAVAIEERINPALQSARMPKKYWRYLTEKPADR